MISVIVCTHNRAPSLARTLESLEEMDPPVDGSWEVVVVDNASDDETRRVVRRFEGRGDLPLCYVFEGEAGLSHARNAGVRSARGEILAFIDDDVRVRSDWLAAMGHAFRDHDVACVGGRALLVADAPRPGWWREEYEGKAGHFERGEEPRVLSPDQDGMVGIGANLAFRRHVFERDGLFRTDLGRKQGRLLMGEELELIDRLRSAGEDRLYYPEAVVYHHPHEERFTKAYLRRWYLSYGEWDFHRKRNRRDDSVRIGGVPRWRYRSALGDLVTWVGTAIARRQERSFFAQLRLLSFFGYLRAAIRHART